MCCFKQNTAYELRISDWSSDVCSSDLTTGGGRAASAGGEQAAAAHRVRLRQAEQVEHGRGDVAQRAAFAQRDSRAFTNVHQRHRADGVRGVRLAGGRVAHHLQVAVRSEEHTSELKSLMRISYAVFCLTQKNT